MSSRTQNLILSLIVLFLVGCSSAPSGNFSFTIVQMNDVYEIAPLDNGKTAGLARVATVKNNLIKENENTIMVLAGDFLSPSLIANLKVDGERIKGKQMVETLNAIGTDYVTFGNHEFDISENDLQKRLDESTFQWTSANTFHKLDSGRAPFEVNGAPISQYIIHAFKNSDSAEFKLGIIGVTLPFNKPDHVEYDDFFDAFSKTYKAIESNCDAVVALTHLDLDDDLELAKRNPKLLMVLGGHDHTNMKYDIGNVLVTKADANAKTLYIHRIDYDAATSDFKINSELLPINDQIESDPDVKKIVDKWVDIQNENLTNLGYDPDAVVFTTTDTLDVLESSIRNHETNFTRMVVESMLYAKADADGVLMNSGSIRLDDLLTGDIYEFDILKAFPYGGSLVSGSIPGESLKKVMDISNEENRDSGGYLQSINITKANGTWMVNGKSIDDKQVYQIILPKFVMEGNEQNLEFLKDFPYTPLESLGPNKVRNDIRDIFIDYKRSN